MPTGREIIKFIKDNNLEDMTIYKILDMHKKSLPYKSKNIIEKHNTYAIVKILNKETELYDEIIIDLDDIDRVSKYTWNIRNKYPRTRINNHSVMMHRYIINYNGNLEVDHINQNKYDNRKINLRIVHKVENLANNKSNHIYKRGNKYHAILNRYGKTYNLGYFNSFDKANNAVNSTLEYISKNKEKLLQEFLQEKQSR